MKLIASAIAYFVLLVSLSAPAMAFQIKGNSYQLTAAEADACTQGGGCALIPIMQFKDDIFKLQESAWLEGSRHGNRVGVEAGYEAGMKAKNKGAT